MRKDNISLSNYTNEDIFSSTIDVSNKRVSNDATMNNYGCKLIDLCRNLDLLILNGRFGPKRSKCSCKNTSIVDYMLVSADIYHDVEFFEVLDFDPLLSDHHKTLSMYMRIGQSDIQVTIQDDINVNVNDCCTADNIRYKWNSDNCDIFVNNIELEDVAKLENTLDTMLTNAGNIVKHQVNDIYHDICNIFKKCAENSDMLFKKACLSNKWKPRPQGHAFQTP